MIESGWSTPSVRSRTCATPRTESRLRAGLAARGGFAAAQRRQGALCSTAVGAGGEQRLVPLARLIELAERTVALGRVPGGVLRDRRVRGAEASGDVVEARRRCRAAIAPAPSFGASQRRQGGVGPAELRDAIEL